MLFDRQDSVHACTRFRLTGRSVTAQPLEKRLVRDEVREFVVGPEQVAGTILPLRFGFAAHIRLGNGLRRVGEFDDEREAFDAITRRFNAANCRRMLSPG
jgi:hypothetical protein